VLGVISSVLCLSWSRQWLKNLEIDGDYDLKMLERKVDQFVLLRISGGLEYGDVMIIDSLLSKTAQIK
jgi:hypothetical protein